MVIDALSGVGDWIMNGLSDAFNSAQARVEEVVGGFWNVLTGALQGDLGSIYDGLIDLFGPQLATTIMSGISAAVNMVMGAGNLLGSIGDWIMTGLSNALSGLGNAVDGGGLASGIRAMLTPIPTLVGALLSRIGPIVRPILANAWNGIVATFRQLATRILTTITSIPTRIGMAFMRVVTVIRLRINQARAIASTLMTQLRNAVVTRILSIPQRVGMIFQLAVQFIRTRLTRAWAIAGQLAGQIRQAIVDKIMEMYHGVQSWFGQLASNIASWLSTAASNTLSGAKQIYDNIVNKVKEIPGKVAEEFGKIPGKISSALAQAASAALTGAANIVSSFLSGMSINSPGKIQRWTQWEFESIPRNIFTSGVEASRNAYSAATNIVRSWTDAMPEILQPQVEFANTPNIHDLRRNIPVDTLTSNIQQMHAVPSSANVLPSTTNNVRNEDNTRHITVENITLECNDLTQAQSRRILYNALQGL
jgi:phage-related protein